MADEEVENTNVPAPVETAPATTCCDARDAATAADCALCKRPVCKNCRRFVNQKQVCVDCLKKILAEIDAEKASAARLLPAVAGGLVAAVLCGAARDSSGSSSACSRNSRARSTRCGPSSRSGSRGGSRGRRTSA
jgi:hypothetical protein